LIAFRHCADGPMPWWLTSLHHPSDARLRRPARALCRHYAPALALSLLAPKLTWSEAETAAGVRDGALVRRADDELLSPHDVKRLQARARSQAGGLPQASGAQPGLAASCCVCVAAVLRGYTTGR